MESISITQKDDKKEQVKMQRQSIKSKKIRLVKTDLFKPANFVLKLSIMKAITYAF